MSDETSDGGISPNNQRHVDWQKKLGDRQTDMRPVDQSTINPICIW